MDLETLRDVSNYFYRSSGIYQKLCNYFATMYRYDWYVIPEVYDEAVKEEKVVKDFSKLLNYLDNSYIKKVCSDIALTVIKNGAYYGYLVELFYKNCLLNIVESVILLAINLLLNLTCDFLMNNLQILITVCEF